LEKKMFSGTLKTNSLFKLIKL